MFCIFLPSVSSQSHKKHPKKGWTKLRETSEKKENKKQKKNTDNLHQLNILEAKIQSKTDPPTSTRAGVGVRTSRNLLRSGTGRFLQAMWTSRATRDLKKNYKLCDQIKLFGDLSRAVFLGKWTLECGSKKLVFKKWIHEGKNLKSKGVASSKTTIFPSVQCRLQGSKRLVDGLGVVFSTRILGGFFPRLFPPTMWCNAWHLWRVLVLIHKI